MREIMVIMKKDLGETLRTKALYVSIAIALFILVALGIGLGGVIQTLIEQGSSPVEITAAIQSVIGATALMLSLMLMMLFSMYINAYTLTMEKAKRSMESLLCTPLSLRQVCLGKSLAVFLPSVVLGLVFTFGGIVGTNQIFIVPKLGRFIMPGTAPLVAILVVVPLIVFFLVSLMIEVQLIITNIRWINAAFMALIFGVGFGFSPVLKFVPSSWSMVLASLGIGAMLALVVVLLSPRVTKEKIILSSKG